VRNGARLVGTNEDATYPTPGRLLPGAGAILAAVATATGVKPEVAGKPHEAIVALIGQRAPQATLVVGDRPSTDGLLAARLGLPFALVRSGVTPPSDPPPDPPPAVDAPDFAAVVDRHLR
jgi:glycerol-1-phosphatase